MTPTTPTRAAILGLGVHGTRIVRLAANAGIRVVGAADTRRAGASLGDVTGVDGLRDITVAADFDALGLRRGDVDVVVFAHQGSHDDLAAQQIRAAEIGANVVSIIVDSFDLAAIPAALREKVDAAAKANDVTIVTTGSQDVSWGALIALASAQIRDPKEIRLHLSIGVDGYPADFLDLLGVGLSPEAFARDIVPGALAEASIAATALAGAAELMDFAVTDATRTITQVTFDEEIHSTTYDETYPAGTGVGILDTSVFESAGVRFVAELATFAVPPGEKDVWVITFDADPRVEVEQRISVPPHTVDATLINRIPDVLAAPAGLVSAHALPSARYHRTV